MTNTNSSASADDYVDFLMFARSIHGLHDACMVVRKLVDNDAMMLKRIDHLFTERVISAHGVNGMMAVARVGNSRNSLLDGLPDDGPADTMPDGTDV